MPRPSYLTPREYEVAALLSQGLSNKLIADKLGIAEHTAKFHVHNVCRKYGTTSRVVAAVSFVVDQIAQGKQIGKACGFGIGGSECTSCELARTRVTA